MATIFDMELNDSEIEDLSNPQQQSVIDYELENPDQMVVNNEIEVIYLFLLLN